jgi:hypothetical protein
LLVSLEFEDFDADDNVEDFPESLDRFDIDRFWRDEANCLEWDLVCGGRLGMDVAESSSEGERARKIRVCGKKCRKGERRARHAAKRHRKRDLTVCFAGMCGSRRRTEAAADVLYALWSAHKCDELSLANGESARWR